MVGRLVEKEQLRVPDEGPRDREPRAPSAGERIDGESGIDDSDLAQGERHTVIDLVGVEPRALSIDPATISATVIPPSNAGCCGT